MTAKIRAAMLNAKWKCIGVSDVQTCHPVAAAFSQPANLMGP